MLELKRYLVETQDIKVKIKNIKSKSKINYIKQPNLAKRVKSTFSGKLKPAEIVIITVE